VVLARGTTDRRSPGWTVGDYAGLVTLLDEGLDVLAGDLIAGIAGLRPPRTPSPEPPSGTPF
jgi:hypothetical protein